MTNDRVLVTGATGFVGSAVARALVARQFRLRVLVRPTSPKTNIANLDCEVVEGDMRDPASAATAMNDVRYLFHVAADYRLWARDPDEIIRNNREGTRALMEAARATGVERVIYTSSVATLKPRREESANENDRSDFETAIGPYKKSKVAAERLVESMVADGLPAVIVSPSTPIGPRDIRPTPTGRMILEAASGRMPAYVDTGLNLVHVDDVAEGHVLALQSGRIGETYIVGGENVTLEKMLSDIAQICGRHAPRFRLPRRPLYPVAFVAEAIASVTGKEPLLTADALHMAKHRMFFDSTKARRELAYSARPYRAALEGAIGWFREAGYLK